MKKFKFLLIGVTCILLIGSCKPSNDNEGENKGEENSPTIEQSASGAQKSSPQAASSLIVGIWKSPKESNEFYVFQEDGEYIEVKLYDDESEKHYGVYTLEGHILKVSYRGQEEHSVDVHFDGNNTMIINDSHHQIVYYRVSQEEYDRRVSGVKKWKYN